MSRRRQTPWIHRWSRQIIAAIALLGAIDTGYLALTKLLGVATICPTSGCEQVLSSSYATIFGLPLSLFGFLAYIGMALFALVPLTVDAEANQELRSSLDHWTWRSLFVGAAAMTVFSSYLMYVMVTEFVAVYGAEGICFYCIASALFTVSMFVITLLGHDWEDIGQLLFTGTLVSMIVLIGTLGVYAGVGAAPAVAQVGPSIARSSGQAELGLVRHLQEIGAKMYGAYWCPHCHDQKQLFGQPAAREVPYIECAPDGPSPQTALCEMHPKEITGFPTWEIKGEFYSGTQTLEKLADLSGYDGPRNFRD